ncbi:MAG: FAD:protein FMN transferase [Inhella sp.]
MLSRRGFGVFGAVALSLLAPATQAALRAAEMRREQRVLMGTRVSLLLPGSASELADLAAPVAAAWAEMARLEALLSRYRGDNPVAALAAQAGRRPLVVPAELRELLQQGKRLSARSGGAFDVTVGAYSDWRFDGAQSLPPAERLAVQRRAVDWRAIEIDGAQVLLNRPGMRLDLGGIAKLPILAAGMAVLQRAGVRHALIDGGGDILAIGQNQGHAWQVGLRDPLQPQQLLGSVPLADGGWVVSSGDYERCFEQGGRRYHHILDPRSGWPSVGVHGVSLLGRDVAALNGLGTALMLRGPDPSLLPAGVEALLVRADGRRWHAGGDAMVTLG